MTRKTRWAAGLCALVGAMLGGRSVALACTGYECVPSRYFPGSVTVPANLPAFLWWPAVYWGGDDAGSATEPSLDVLRLARIDGDRSELVDVELRPPLDDGAPWEIVLGTPLMSGGRYVLWDATGCRAAAISDTPPEPAASDFAESTVGSVRFTVGATAPLPTTFATLTATAPALGSAEVPGGADCSEPATVLFRDLELAFSDESRPWADALFYETLVDGKPYNPTADIQGVDLAPGTPLVGRDHDRVYTRCQAGASEGVGPGRHRALIRARVPGTDTWLKTNEVTFEFDCAAAAADPQDAGSATADDAGDAPSRPARRANDSGGCSIASAPGVLGPAWAIALLLLWRRPRVRRFTKA